jgi:hypothetical protein
MTETQMVTAINKLSGPPAVREAPIPTKSAAPTVPARASSWI